MVGTLPPGLRVLTPRFVEIYEDWFGPELFDTLEMLLLQNMHSPSAGFCCPWRNINSRDSLAAPLP